MKKNRVYLVYLAIILGIPMLGVCGFAVRGGNLSALVIILVVITITALALGHIEASEKKNPPQR